jgi:hypothetical protein
MNRVFLVLFLLFAAVVVAYAQTASPPPTAAVSASPTPATAPAPTPARALAPFVAAYEVYRGGKAFGDATLQLAKVDGGRWRVDLGIRGTRGLIGLAGLNLQQSTLFDVSGEQYRPLSQSTVRKALFGNRKSTGVYDWSRHLAQWQGDIKETRRGAVTLQDGDMSGLLINLAVLRDAQPGATLQYRFVDDGRVRNHQYVVAGEREPQVVDEISYSAMRVTRAKGGDEETILWVVEGVPMPIRILQREDGEDVTDLRLKEYKGA